MRLLYLFGMVEQPSGVATMVSNRCDKSIEQRPFLSCRCLTIVGCDLQKHLASCLIPQRLFHSSLL
jgi:hypothetical protein